MLIYLYLYYEIFDFLKISTNLYNMILKEMFVFISAFANVYLGGNVYHV